MVFGKAFNFESLAASELIDAPVKRIDSLIRMFSSRVIHLAIVFEWTVVDFVKRLNEQHQVFGRIPSVHQHGLERQLFLIDRVA